MLTKINLVLTVFIPVLMAYTCLLDASCLMPNGYEETLYS